MNEDTLARLKRFSKFIVSHPLYTASVEQILRGIDATTACSEPGATLLTGESGTGKTTVCRHVINMLPQGEIKLIQGGIARTIPAFYCGIPASVTLKGMAIEMLSKLGCSEMNGDQVILLRRLVVLLKTCETQVIFLDDFHHLLVRGAEKTRSMVCNWVKCLMNETMVPIVLVGLPECEQIVDKHEQLARRYPYRAYLKSFSFSTAPDSDFIKLLKAFDRAIEDHAGVNVVTPLTDINIAAAIYVATGGYMNALRQLLHEALRIALTRGDTLFNIEDLAESFCIVRLEGALVYNKNPFLLPAKDVHTIIARKR